MGGFFAFHRHMFKRLLHSLAFPKTPLQRVEFKQIRLMQMSLCGHSGRPLRLIVTLLLLELPELRLDGYGRLLSLWVLHVDVEVLRDVRLGSVWRGAGKETAKWSRIQNSGRCILNCFVEQTE